MNILVNVNSLQPPVTGIGRYTSEILKCLVDKHNIQAFDPIRNYSKEQLKVKLRQLDKASVSQQKKR